MNALRRWIGAAIRLQYPAQPGRSRSPQAKDIGERLRALRCQKLLYISPKDQ